MTEHKTAHAVARSGWAVAGLLLVACGDGSPIGDTTPPLPRDALLDPETCRGCHPVQYNEWSHSMHAAAADDPVFIAMNQRGQREAKLGTFCVKCHAPMAVLEGQTQDGLNLAEVPRKLKGVTCYFCHNATAVGETHNNNSLSLANDSVMRGPLRDALEPTAHGVAYSSLHDHAKLDSSAMCGACHDILTPNRVRLERTLEEYQSSTFARLEGTPGFQGCPKCHMEEQPRGPVALYPQDPRLRMDRVPHEHLWPAVDVSLLPNAGDDVLRTAVEKCALPHGMPPFGEAQFAASAAAPGFYTVTLETTAGHSLPSGSSHDRRVWLELIAFDAQDRVTTSIGALSDGEETFGEGVWAFHDRIYDAEGREAHMFWDAAVSARFPPNGVEQRGLPVASPTNPNHSLPNTFFLGTPPPARVELRVRMRPIGLSVLQDLVQTGDLDPAFVAAMPTFTLQSATVRWKSAREDDFTLTRTTPPDECYRYKCWLRAQPGEDCSIFDPVR